MPRSREELVAALRGAASMERARGDSAHLAVIATVQRERAAALTEAADLLDSLEGEEFRVVGVESALGRRYENDNATSLKGAEGTADHFRSEGDRHVRIQRRTTTPWTNVEEPSDD